MELSKKQIAYLKSLDSKKKKRKFLLDCLIENIEISESKGLFGIKNIEFHFQYEDKENRKSNYSPEEIELVKHNINQREVTEQGSELLKFDMLEDNKKEFYLSKKQIKDSKAKKSKHYKYLFFSSKQLTKEQIDEIVEFITENNQSAK